jgi:hypothetical protein
MEFKRWKLTNEKRYEHECVYENDEDFSSNIWLEKYFSIEFHNLISFQLDSGERLSKNVILMHS